MLLALPSLSLVGTVPYDGAVDLRNRLYVVLGALFLTALITANLIAGKVIVVFGIEMSAGVIPFPVTFVLTDIINEYYGRDGARFLTLVGLAMMVFAIAIIYLGRILPVGESSYVTQAAYDNVFGLSWRLALASLCAYLLGQLSDIYFFRIIKRATRGRLLWLRATGSTTISQIIDSGVVTFTVFAGALGASDIATLAAFAYLYKMLVAAALTPLLYIAHDVVTRWLKIEPAPLPTP